jgi:alpha-beta hydrolase superfamily lysophospholipase
VPCGRAARLRAALPSAAACFRRRRRHGRSAARPRARARSHAPAPAPPRPTSLALHDSEEPRPGPFYAAPSPLPHGPPGTLIRWEEIVGSYPGAKAYRVLYKSTAADGSASAVSGVVFVPEGPAPRGGRRVIAFTHGTVGVAGNCAPSLHAREAPQVIGGLGSFLAAGYVVAATDYAGLGTSGRNPYLVGRVEAMTALDSVRAAHRLHAAHAGTEFAVWGHSQGGQAALFTAQIAPSYAPGLRLVGAVAGAPLPDLPALFRVNVPSPTARSLIAITLVAWERYYRDPRLQAFLSPQAQAAALRIARYCLYSNEPLSAIPVALASQFTVTGAPPWHEQPWRSIVLASTPANEPVAVPVLLTQGGADQIVPPALTERLARRMCARGERVELRLYPSVGHAEAGIVVAPDVASWIGERFAGRPAPSTCL